MGLFGGSSQSTSTVTSSIDFSPVIQFGEEQSATQDKVMEQTTVTTPKLDDGFTASVGVGVGGAGTGGAVIPSEGEESFSLGTDSPLANLDQNTLILLGGAVLIGGIIYFKKNKKA